MLLKFTPLFNQFIIELQAEFMEHDEKPLPIDIRLLGALAEKVYISLVSFPAWFLNTSSAFSFVSYSFTFLCPVQCRAFAKALHYKEMEF